MRFHVYIFLSHKRFSICTNIGCIIVIIIIWSTHIFHFYGPYWLEFVCVRRPLDLQLNGLNRLLGRRRSGPRSIAALVYTYGRCCSIKAFSFSGLRGSIIYINKYIYIMQYNDEISCIFYFMYR